MRLIDADALKIDYGFTWDDITPTHEEMYALIDRQPTIEPERKTGHWIACENKPWWSGGGYWKCSNCGYGFSFEAYLDADEWDYCPKCGSAMTEGEEHENQKG
jgi:hypothetical protein